MQKKGYSGSCASCMAQLVGCSRDHCMNQCISAEGEHVEDCRISSGNRSTPQDSCKSNLHV